MVVEGDPELQQAVRFALFHVLQASARAERRAMPAKGLTGTGYDGHAFWDTETSSLPVLTHTVPEAAADAARLATLDAPYRRAASTGAGARRRGIPLAHDPRRRVLAAIGRRARRPSTSTPTVADAVVALRERHRRPRVRARHRCRPARRDGAALAVPGPPRRARLLPHRRRHRTRRVQRARGQQRLHEPHGPTEPLRRGGHMRSTSRRGARRGA